MYGMSVETLDDLVGAAALKFDAAVELLLPFVPIAPSCLRANVSSAWGFVVLEGRGGGVLRPFVKCCEA
jgi:hypothetical protein